MWPLWLLLIVNFIPLLPILLLVYRTYSFATVVIKKRVMRELEFTNFTWSLLLPRKMKAIIDNNKAIIDRDKKFMISEYTKMFWVILLYGAFWLGYIGFIVWRFFNLININFNEVDSTQYGTLWGSWLWSIYFTSVMFVGPLFKSFGINSISGANYKIWKRIIKFTDVITEKSKIVIRYCVYIIPSFSCLYIYLYILKIVVYIFSIQSSIVTWLVVLMIYQYGVVSILSKILTKINKKNYYKKIYNDIIDNSTYLSMVLIYSLNEYGNKSVNLKDNPIMASLAILFLIDVFIKKDKEINNEKNEIHISRCEDNRDGSSNIS